MKAAAVAWLVSAVLGSVTAEAAPTRDQPFPAVVAKDLTGHRQDVRRYQGERTLVVVMTDRHAGEAIRAWYAAADGRMDPSVQRLSLFSLNLPFFVSDDYARAKAREQVPRPFWDDTLLDTSSDMAHRIGVERGRKPWVFALDGRQRVLETFQGYVTDPGAERIWRALR